jgi:ethanolamine utilization microcompartment shell protein EutS
MIRSLLVATLALSASLPPATAAEGAGRDRERVNGSITVTEGDRAGDVTTVNGSVNIGMRATVSDAQTVNGSISLGEDSVASSLETVNGSINLGVRSRVSGDVETVNGSITLGRSAAVAGDVRNVAGRIVLDGGRISGDLETVKGDIELRAGARLDGDLIFEKPSMGVSLDLGDPPRVVVGPGAAIGGTLRFGREVKLYVSDRAEVGKIEGATPVRFSGDTPPKD